MFIYIHSWVRTSKYMRELEKFTLINKGIGPIPLFNFSVAEPKLFIFGSSSTFVHIFGSVSRLFYTPIFEHLIFLSHASLMR